MDHLKIIRKHWLSYMILIAGLSILALLFSLAWPERFWLRVVSLTIAGFYFVWGWITHAQHGPILRTVLLEYLGISLLGLSALWLITI